MAKQMLARSGQFLRSDGVCMGMLVERVSAPGNNPFLLLTQRRCVMRCKCTRLVVFVLAAILVALSPSKMLAQMAGSGSVGGTVTDPSGAAVAGATVTLTDTSTNAPRTSTTNEAGRYFVANVLPGTYDVTIARTGFRQAKLTKQVVSEIGRAS